MREDRVGWGEVPGVWRGVKTSLWPGELVFTWEETDGGVALTGLLVDDFTRVTVPATIDGKKVVAIAENAFAAATGLRRVTFEGERPVVLGTGAGLDSSVVVYARYPATGWPDAELAPMPSTWQGCRLEFFTHAESFWKTATLEDGTLAITGTVGAYANLGGTAILPGEINGTNVTAVAPYAFARYQDLTEILIHPNIVTLGEGAFYKTPIGTLVLPPYVANATNAFVGCTNLTALYVTSAATPAWLTEMGADPSNCVVYAAFDATGWGTLPTKVGEYAVEPFSHLEGFWVTGPATDGNGVSVTGTAKVPEGLVLVPPVIRGQLVSEIGNGAFSRCAQLKEVVLPETLTRIGADAFAQSAALTNVTFRSGAPVAPESVGLDPATCTIFAPYRSEGWDYGLSTWQGVPIVWYPAPEPSDEPASHLEAFWRTEENGDGTLTIIGLNGTCVGEAIVPSKIGGKPVTALGAIFANCTNLTAVTVPASVTQIASGAFAGCTALTTVSFYGSQPEVDGSLGLDGENCVICYDRKFAAQWDDGSGRWQGCWLFGYTHGDEFWKTETNPDGSLTVVGCNGNPEGEMVIPPMISNTFVKAIAPGAFSNCTALTALEVAIGIKTVGADAFAGDTALAKVVLYDGVELGAGAFRDCALTSVKLPSAQVDIPAAVFSNCTALADVTFPTNLAFLGANAFAGCAVSSLTLASTLTNVGEKAFADCRRLRALTFLGNAPEAAEDLGLDGNVTIITVMPGTDGWGTVPGF